MSVSQMFLRCAKQRATFPVYSGVNHIRCVSDCQSDNANIRPINNFVNRNPRNLERLRLKPTDHGWGMEWEGYAKSRSSNLPRRNYYYRMDFWTTSSHSYAEVQHWSGDTVIEASTQERCINQHLHSATDVMAASNLGKIIAERCLRAGISSVSFRFPEGLRGDSEKVVRFQQGAEEHGLLLEEPNVRRLDYVKQHEVNLGTSPPELD